MCLTSNSNNGKKYQTLWLRSVIWKEINPLSYQRNSLTPWIIRNPTYVAPRWHACQSVNLIQRRTTLISGSKVYSFFASSQTDFNRIPRHFFLLSGKANFPSNNECFLTLQRLFWFDAYSFFAPWTRRQGLLGRLSSQLTLRFLERGHKVNKCIR